MTAAYESEKLRTCQFCGAILPPWRLFDCDGKNQHGRGNCEMANGSGGCVYHPEMLWDKYMLEKVFGPFE